ncbi:MAG: hypothetical protein WBF79_07830 [Rhodococcus sp. (in: high G+C Gram-positive bacteria)]
MIRRILPGVIGVLLIGVATVLWILSRVTTTVTETFPTTPRFDGFSVTYDSTHISGPLMGLSVVAAAVAVYLLMRTLISQR